MTATGSIGGVKKGLKIAVILKECPLKQSNSTHYSIEQTWFFIVISHQAVTLCLELLQNKSRISKIDVSALCFYMLGISRENDHRRPLCYQLAVHTCTVCHDGDVLGSLKQSNATPHSIIQARFFDVISHQAVTRCLEPV